MPPRTRRRTALRVEPLEARETPAGLVAVSVSAAGALTLAAVPGADGDEAVTVSRRADGAYLLAPGPGTTLRVGGADHTTSQAVFGVTGGLTARLGAGHDIVHLTGSAFPDSVAIDLGAGDNSLNVFDSTIAGDLTVTAGPGSDIVGFGGTATAVGGKFTARLGNGSNLVNTGLLRATFGAIRVDGGAGPDTLVLANNDLDLAVQAGGLTFNGGGGANAVTLGDGAATVAVVGPVRITGSGAADSVAIGGARFDAASLGLALGAGTNSLVSTATDFHLTGGLTWASGAGSDTLRVAGTAARIGGAVAVDVGDGAAVVRLGPERLLAVGQGATLRSGVAAGPRDLSLSTSEDTVVGGPVTVAAGPGPADVSVFGFHTLTAGGDVRVTRGAGPGRILVGSNGPLLVDGSVAIARAGAEGSSQMFGGWTGDATVTGSVTITGGASQSVVMGGVIRGSVTLTGAAGAAADLWVQRNGLRPLAVGGPVRLTSRAAAGQASRVVVWGLAADGPLTVTGGAGAERLMVDGAAVGGAFTAALAAGADRVELEQMGDAAGSAFAGPVVLRGGAGDDTFLVGGDRANDAVSFRGAVAVDGGAGADTLTVGTRATFDAASPLAATGLE